MVLEIPSILKNYKLFNLGRHTNRPQTYHPNHKVERIKLRKNESKDEKFGPNKPRNEYAVLDI